MKVSIYSTDDAKVYELTEQKMCPGSYDFTWDGRVNTGYYGRPPDGGRAVKHSTCRFIHPLQHNYENLSRKSKPKLDEQEL